MSTFSRLDSKYRSFKQSYLVGDHVQVCQTLEAVGWYYKVGTFHLDLCIKDKNHSCSWMRDEKFVTVTTADQIFMSDLTEKHHKMSAPTLNGVLYDHSFPEQITVQVHDERHISKNNAASRGYLGVVNISKEFSQRKLKIGTSVSTLVPMHLINLENAKDHVECEVTMTYKYTNESIAKDTDMTNHFLRNSMPESQSYLDDKKHGKEKWHAKHNGCDGLHVILVPGLFTGAYPGYFDENRKALTKMGIDHSIAPIKSEDPVDRNAAILRDYVKEITGKIKGVKLILMCHSKGGCDVLDVLTHDHTGEYAELIYGVVNMQSPIGGTPMVEWLQGGGGGIAAAAKGTGVVVDKMFGLNATGAVTDLSLNGRNKYMSELFERYGRKDDFNLEKMFGVHFLSFCSWADFGESHNMFEAVGKMSMGVTNKRIEEFGHRSDGLVALQAGRLPGGDVILVNDAYHTTPALHMKGNAYHSGTLTLALLDVMLTNHPLVFSPSVSVSKINAMLKDNPFNMQLPGYLPCDENKDGSKDSYTSKIMASPTVNKLADKMKHKFH